jgi:hypothetical protein
LKFSMEDQKIVVAEQKLKAIMQQKCIFEE